MAWRDVNYSCGHIERVQFYGPGRERDRKQEWMERGVCPDCYRAQKEEEKRQENERAANLQNEIGFAQLNGSDKQIAWANTIRQQTYERLVASLRSGDPIHKTCLVEALNLETSSKWWIDNRNCGVTDVMNIIAGNYPVKAAEINAKSKEVAND